MIKSFTQAVKFIEQHIPPPEKKYPGELGLSRMQYLMDLLGNPQLKYPTIHVGGTSGKGSTSTFIASILATKYKVGLHTSPHLVSITERILIYGSCRSRVPNSASKSLHFVGLKASEATFGSPSLASPVYKINEISQRAFIDLLNKIIPVIDEIKKSMFGPPSYFEVITAIAFLHFYMQQVDIAVIEVGMGGRFDATNVIKPLVAVLTNVGVDHTEILGDTIEKIARDKVGIIKPGIKVVSGVKQPSVIKIVEARITNNESRISLLGRDFRYKIKSMDEQGSVFDYYGRSGSDLKCLKGLTLSLLGEHQVENAALAIRAVESLSSRAQSRDLSRMRDSLEQVERFLTSFGMTETDITLGLRSAFIPGRLEIIRRNPLVILDGAHNPDKVKTLVGAIKKIFPKKRVTSIIAIKVDKNASEMLEQLLKISKKVIFTKFQLIGDIGLISSYDPERLLEIAYLTNRQLRYTSRHSKVVKEMLAVDNIKQAFKEAIESANTEDLILVTGSLYLVGEINKYTNKQISK